MPDDWLSYIRIKPDGTADFSVVGISYDAAYKMLCLYEEDLRNKGNAEVQPIVR